jgi:GT2 family glycosyltransferase
MSDPVVTVVIPSHGRPQRLRDCLEALAAQTLQEPWDLVVIDDGSPEPLSPDGLGIDSHPGWRLIRQANAGPAAARNRGVREARGEFIAFTDDDCRPEPAWLEALMRAVRERPGALVGGTTINGLPEELFASTSQLIVDLVYEHFNTEPDNAYFLTSNNILCPRERFVAVGGFDESFPRAGAEDRDFCDRWRLAEWPIVWRRDACVEHRHSQTFRTFLDLHFRYGRGAHRYQAVRRARDSGTMREDLGFHKTLPRRVARRLARQGSLCGRIATGTALGIWQVANAAGFFVEFLEQRLRFGPLRRERESSSTPRCVREDHRP